MDLKLQGKHVLITGSAGGIGISTAEHFLFHGANVSLHYNTQKDTLKGFLEKYPHQTFLIQADATQELSVIDCFKAAHQRFGVCHILIANHAIYETKSVSIDQMSLTQWQRMVDISLTGVFLFCREFCKQLRCYADKLSSEERKQAHASIVIIGATSGKFGEANHIDYATIKSGLMYGFTRSLKNEISRIIPRATVNTVAPGLTRTTKVEEEIKQGLLFKMLHTTALCKVAETDDVSRAILFLASPVSGHISGNVLMVDGGMEGRVLWTDKDLKSRL